MTDPAYQYRLDQALEALCRRVEFGDWVEFACEQVAQAHRVSFRDLLDAFKRETSA